MCEVTPYTAAVPATRVCGAHTCIGYVVAAPCRGHLVNAVDTPGHADFGGEVER